VVELGCSLPIIKAAVGADTDNISSFAKRGHRASADNVAAMIG
jgi:hypothetical protein